MEVNHRLHIGPHKAYNTYSVHLWGFGERMIGKSVLNYTVTSELGSGGMGVVYEARDNKLKRSVAIKSLSEGLATPERLRLFEREAQVASAINHPSIVTIHDMVYDDDQVYIVMEKVPGKSLSRMIASGGMNWRYVVTLAVQVAEALEAAHNKGIVHRDLKPSNIMVTPQNRVKVLDFGIAKLNPSSEIDQDCETISRTSTQGHKRVLGTLAYMSPEQSMAREVDERTDFFSLGVVLYEALSGKRPFRAPHEAALIHQLHYEEPEDLAKLAPQVPTALVGVVEKLMEKRPRDRFQNAEELCVALESVLSECENSEDPLATVSQRKKTLPPGQSVAEISPAAAWPWKRVMLGVGIGLAVLAIALFIVAISTSPESGTEEGASAVPSLVVIPFEVGPQIAQSTSGQAIARYVTTAAGKWAQGRLRVVPQLEVQSKKIESIDTAISQADGDYVISGEIRKEDEAARASITLVETESRSQLASESFLVSTEEDSVIRQMMIMHAVGLLNAYLELPALPSGQQVGAGSGKKTPEEICIRARRLLREPRREGALDEAMAGFQQALAIDSEFAPAFIGLALCYFRKFYDEDRDGPWLGKAEQVAMRALEVDGESADTMSVLGLILVHDGRMPEGLNYLDRALSLNPFSSDAHRGMGDYWRKLGKWSEASAFYKNALSLRPDDYELLNLLGTAHYRTSEYDEAISLFQRSIEMMPDDFVAYRNLGAVFFAKGDPAQATLQFEKALSIKPDQPTVHSNLGTLLYFQGRYAESADAFEKALDNDGPNAYLLWGNFADALRWVPGRESDAEESYSVAIRLISEQLEKNDNDPKLLSRRAVLLAKAGRDREAKGDLRSLDRLELTGSAAFYRMALALELVGDRQGALDSLGDALDAGYSMTEVANDPELLELRKSSEYHRFLSSREKTN